MKHIIQDASPYDYLLYVKGIDDLPEPPNGVEAEKNENGVWEVRLPPHPRQELVERTVEWLTKAAPEDGEVSVYDPQRGVTTPNIPPASELYAHTSARGHIVSDDIAGDPGAYGEMDPYMAGSFFERHPTLVVMGSIVILYFLMDLGMRLLFGCN